MSVLLAIVNDKNVRSFPSMGRERSGAANVGTYMKAHFSIALLGLLTACGALDSTLPQMTDGGLGPALTYTELFAQFFAPGTPGHCATGGCHADPGHNVWLCGTTKDTCYDGMVSVGLVNPAKPQASAIADPRLSPLTWINPTGGNMPYDAMGPNPAGRDAIAAWVAAGAQNN